MCLDAPVQQPPPLDGIVFLGVPEAGFESALAQVVGGLPTLRVEVSDTSTPARELGPRRLSTPEPRAWTDLIALQRLIQSARFLRPLVVLCDDRLRRVVGRLAAAYSIDARAHSTSRAATDAVLATSAGAPDLRPRLSTDLHELPALLPRRTPTPVSTEGAPKPKVLVLYADYSLFTNAVVEHIKSMSFMSWAEVYYAPATHAAVPDYPLECFDAVIIHYSVRLSMPDYISPAYATALARYSGVKALFLQDEYEGTEMARQWMERLGIHVLFTCVPDESVDQVYPRARFPWLVTQRVLTGYVPAALEAERPTRPLAERPNHIIYRGRPLPYWYGDLGREKYVIGQGMRAICEQRGVPCDIEWAEEARIYGDKWYDFLESGRATLGSESGSNVFDDHRHIMNGIKAALVENPGLTYDEARQRFLVEHEGKVRMNQVSPRVFEAIVSRTALVLFRGEYSGVVQPDIHFIPLEKDVSNADEVLAKLQDLPALEAMTQRAYQDVVASRAWSYQSFADIVGDTLRRRLGPVEPHTLVTGVQGATAPVRAHLAQVSPTGLPTQEPVERKPTDGLAAKFGGYTMWRLPQYYLQRTRAVVGRRVAALRGGS